MTTIFDDTPKYPGLHGDLARVTSIEDLVKAGALNPMAARRCGRGCSGRRTLPMQAKILRPRPIIEGKSNAPSSPKWRN